MAPDSRSPQPRLASFVILSGVVLLLGSLITGYLIRSRAGTSENGLPRRIAGYSLNSARYGPEAIAEIARMHGEEFPTTFGAMGSYGENNQVSLWIEGFQDQSTASQILSEMTAKIALGNSPFSPVGANQVGYRAINQLDGMGQKHIYFQSGNLVVWLAADPPVSDRAFKQILEDYP